MRIARNTPKKARIEIIPMIDTMFFLLVFFMIATLSMSTQQSMPVNLPHASAVQSEKQETVTVTLTKDNKMFVNKEEMPSSAAVTQKIKEKSRAGNVSAVINADKSVEHGRVIETMDEIRKAGVTKIAVAVNPS
jgi:biopolymer transport protein ExbD